MAALPLANLSPSISYLKRRPLALSERRLAANRRNAARSTGPRTAAGKARVARNAIKHGFFADAAQWTEQQHRDFASTFNGLSDEFRPQDEREEICVAIIADSYVRMATMLRYENVAALKEHRRQDHALNERIASAEPAEAARLQTHREELRRAGLWRPTIPGPREAQAIIRYEGRLHRTIRAALTELGMLKGHSSTRKAQKQTHFIERNRGIFDFHSNITTTSARTGFGGKVPKGPREDRHPISSTAVNRVDHKNAKTNPLSSTFAGNRHQRRRAKALARRQT